MVKIINQEHYSKQIWKTNIEKQIFIWDLLPNEVVLNGWI